MKKTFCLLAFVTIFVLNTVISVSAEVISNYFDDYYETNFSSSEDLELWDDSANCLSVNTSGESYLVGKDNTTHYAICKGMRLEGSYNLALQIYKNSSNDLYYLFNYKDENNYYALGFINQPTFNTVAFIKKVNGVETFENRIYVLTPEIFPSTAYYITLKRIFIDISYNANGNIRLTCKYNNKTFYDYETTDNTFTGGYVGFYAKTQKLQVYSMKLDARALQCTVNSQSFIDNDTNASLTKLEPGKNVSYVLDVKNVDTTDLNASVFVCLYDSNNSLRAIACNNTLLLKGDNQVTAQITLPNDVNYAGARLVGFLWNDLTQSYSLTEEYTATVTD